MDDATWRAALESIFDDAENAGRRLILDAADRLCTKKQRAALELLLDGKSTTEIGRAMGVSQPTAHNHIYGHPTHGGGALVKLREDSALREEIERMATKKKDGPAEVVQAWFAGLAPSRHHLFGPLAVLLVMEHIADARRSLSISDLALYVPKPIVGAALPQLRAAGYIATDGVGITIKRTPIDELRRAKENG